MITFVCVIFQPSCNVPPWSSCYDGTWVDKLYRGVKRNYRGDFRFVVLHDDHDYEIHEPVTKIPLLGKFEGWGNLAEAWRPDLSDGPIMVMDLDTIIVGDITDLANTECDVGLHTIYTVRGLCNGVSIFSRKYANHLWELWNKELPRWKKEAILNGKLSEMVFLRIVAANDAVILNHIHLHQIASYKKQYAKRLTWRNPARIVCFHGNPKPDAIGEAEIVTKHWV